MFYSQLNKGKLHGCIDVGLSVMSIKKKAMCIDLDTEDNIYHLKVTLEAHVDARCLQTLTAASRKFLLLIRLCGTQVKSPELFEEWVSKMRHHRVFRQNEIAMYPHERHLFHPHASSSPSLNDSLRKVSCSGAFSCKKKKNVLVVPAVVKYVLRLCEVVLGLFISPFQTEGYSYQAGVSPPG